MPILFCNLVSKKCIIVLLLLLLLFKKVGSARLRESGIHPISPKTPAPQYQPIDKKKRKGKRIEDYSTDREAKANKEALALLLKPASPTPSNTGLAKSFQRDPEKGIIIMVSHRLLSKWNMHGKSPSPTTDLNTVRN